MVALKLTLWILLAVLVFNKNFETDNDKWRATFLTISVLLSLAIVYAFGS